MASTRARWTDDVDVRAVLAELVNEVHMLRLVVERLPQLVNSGRGPRDAADAAWLRAVAIAVSDQCFTARELIGRARRDPALHAAFVAVDSVSGGQTGKLLGRLEAQRIGGLWLERRGKCRAGLRWRVRVCEGDSRVAALSNMEE